MSYSEYVTSDDHFEDPLEKLARANRFTVPKDVIALIRDTAEKTADGRRTLVNPKKAVDTAMKKAA